jgi:hypothetical protein
MHKIAQGYLCRHLASGHPPARSEADVSNAVGLELAYLERAHSKPLLTLTHIAPI